MTHFRTPANPFYAARVRRTLSQMHLSSQIEIRYARLPLPTPLTPACRIQLRPPPARPEHSAASSTGRHRQPATGTRPLALACPAACSRERSALAPEGDNRPMLRRCRERFAHSAASMPLAFAFLRRHQQAGAIRSLYRKAPQPDASALLAFACLPPPPASEPARLASACHRATDAPLSAWYNPGTNGIVPSIANLDHIRAWAFTPKSQSNSAT